ncbi:Vam6/Vps39-like protein [Nymphaea thermarum]|nr:Vam6/Vps39-like protein [Nymphaea thermarum]
MVHSAYDSFQILRDVPSRIETVAAWNSKLFFACADGSLRVYSLPSDRLAVGGTTLSRDEPPSYVLERTFPGFFRKGTSVSLLSLGSRNLLLSLSDAVAFHRLPSLEAAVSLSKTKGASSYDWDDRRGFLCVGRQRKVIIYRHEGGKDFTEVKEFNVPDVIKSIIWCGENICLSIKKEYMIMNSTTGALSEVFPCGRIAAPLITPLPSEQLLLGKIRSLRVPYQLVQTIALREIRHLLSADGFVVAALDTSVYGLLPVPLGAQINKD